MISSGCLVNFLGWVCETKGGLWGPSGTSCGLPKFDHMVPVYLCKHEQVFPAPVEAAVAISDNCGWHRGKPFRSLAVCGGLDVYSLLTFSEHPSLTLRRVGGPNSDPLPMVTSQSPEHAGTVLHSCSKLRTLKGEFSWMIWVGPAASHVNLVRRRQRSEPERDWCWS